MKIFHNVRTLLSKVKTFDIFFIVLAILAVFTFYIFFKRETTFITIRIKVTDENALYANTLPGNEYTSSFKIGDTERNELGNVIAEIVNIETYKKSSIDNVVYLDVRLQATYNPRKKVYSFRGKQATYGESFIFSFSKVRVKGLVVDFPGFRDEKSITKGKTVVVAQLRYDSRYYSDVYGVPSYLAYSIKKNDQVTNSKGEVWAKVLDVTVKPAQRSVPNINGQIVQSSDSELFDVFYAIELSTYELSNELYTFDFVPVIIGQTLPLNFKQVAVFPTITKIGIE